MSKVLKHVDKEEIITKLSDGESVRSIEGWLKQKYPNNKRLWLTSVTLQGFRKNNLQLDGKVLKDIQIAGKTQKQQIEEQKTQQQLQSSDAYQKKINEIADGHLDVARKILQLDKVIESRLEWWYNKVASGDSAASGDKEIRGYIDRQMNLLAQYKKFVEGLADKTIDYNLNITVINDQIIAIRDIIRECMSEFDPEVSMRFMEKLSNKLQNTVYKTAELPNPIKLEELKEAEFEIINSEITNDK